MFEAFKLRTELVESQEEELRTSAKGLDETYRKLFFDSVSKKLKDPDTYAVLNWFFITGIHHYYLGKYLRGSVNLVVPVLLGFIGSTSTIEPIFPAAIEEMASMAEEEYLGFFEFWLVGTILMALIEVPNLFRSQVIVKDYNNSITAQTFLEIKNFPSHPNETDA